MARTSDTDTSLRQHVHDLERLIQHIVEVQARQIDRERSVPGSDPAELIAIDAGLAVVRGLARKLADLRTSGADSA